MRTTSLRLLEAQPTGTGERVWTEVPARRARLAERGILAVTATALLAASVLVGRPTYRVPEAHYVHVTVKSGDTLWSLARRYGHPGQYLPKTIHEIRAANKMATSAIQPGQELLVPVQAPARIEWQAGTALARSARDASPPGPKKLSR